MSSHFIPLPRSSIMRASSSADHLLCFFAGDSAECGPRLRFAAIAVVVLSGGSEPVEGLALAASGAGGGGGGYG